MIVDDESINIMVVEKYLVDAGFRNLVATGDPGRSCPPWIRKTPTSCCWIS